MESAHKVTAQLPKLSFVITIIFPMAGKSLIKDQKLLNFLIKLFKELTLFSGMALSVSSNSPTSKTEVKVY
jgi:hypothetical protein